MGIPAELLPYAENFYRRFPEELISLGMPGLENVFDLRPSGSWSRSIKETQTEKTVEITIRRWSGAAAAPPVPGLVGAHYGAGPMPNPWQPTGCGVPPYAVGPFQVPPPMHQALWPHTMAPSGCCQPPSTSAPPAPVAVAAAAAPAPAAAALGEAAAAAASAGEAERLLRLESALSALKPQIEALITMQAAAAAAAPPAPAAGPVVAGTATPPAAPAPLVAPSEAPSMGHAQTLPNLPAAGDSQILSQSGTSTPPMPQPSGLTLKDRRNVMNLQIQTVPKSKPAEPAPAAQPLQQPLQQPQQQQQQPDKLQRTESQPTARQGPPGALQTNYLSSVDTRRPTVNINAVRVAPAALDPASPRSPGRFSAWK